MEPRLRAALRVARKATHVCSIYLPVDPLPTPRPRVSKWGVYYPKSYTDWRDAVAKYLTGHPDITGPLLVCIESVKQAPKKSKLTHPKPDVDNFAKGPMDSISRAEGYWEDDYQVAYLLTNKRWTKKGEEAHTSVEIYSIEEDTRP